MNNPSNSESRQNSEDDLLPEYNFDYSRARPNRFATQLDRKSVTVTLEPDIAAVFKTSEEVNHALRAILSALPSSQN